MENTKVMFLQFHFLLSVSTHADVEPSSSDSDEETNVSAPSTTVSALSIRESVSRRQFPSRPLASAVTNDAGRCYRRNRLRMVRKPVTRPIFANARLRCRRELALHC
jgi:hypothetical protein